MRSHADHDRSRFRSIASLRTASLLDQSQAVQLTVQTIDPILAGGLSVRVTRAAPPLRDRVVDTVRRALAASVIFLCLFLFVRSFALEPFGVPTGSMAGTLLGNHRE